MDVFTLSMIFLGALAFLGTCLWEFIEEVIREMRYRRYMREASERLRQAHDANYR
jgi:hypothetical protein